MGLIKDSISFWLPPNVDDRPAFKLRATVAVAILLFNLLAYVALQIPILFYRSIPTGDFSTGHLISAAMILFYYFPLRHFKKHGSLNVASNTICMVTYISCLFLSLSTGQYPSVLTLLFVAPPMIGYLLQGRTAGNIWALVVIATELVLAVATVEMGFQPYDLFPETMPAVTTIHLLLVTVMVIGAFSLSHHLNLQLQQALFEETSRLEYLASHDSLTGLHNRRSFEAMLDELAKPGQLRPFALMLMDINRFKAINDSNGHQVGDQVLQEFASKLKQSVREFDFVARVGGDEFAVILNNLNDHTETKGIIALIAERLQQNILVNGRTLAARASIGVALWPGTAGNAHDVYSKADEAMYASKRQGREYIIYDDYEPSPRRAQLTY